MNLHDEMLKMKNAVRSKTGGTNTITGKYLSGHIENIPTPLDESTIHEANLIIPVGYYYYSRYEDDDYYAYVYGTAKEYSTGKADIYIAYRPKASTDPNYIHFKVGNSRVESDDIHCFRNQDGCIDIFTGYGIWYQPTQYTFNNWQYVSYLDVISGPYLPEGLRDGQLRITALYRLVGYYGNNNTLIACISLYYSQSPVWGNMYFAVEVNNVNQANYPRVYIDETPTNLYHRRLDSLGGYNGWFTWARQPIGWFETPAVYASGSHIVLLFNQYDGSYLLMINNGYSYEGSHRKVDYVTTSEAVEAPCNRYNKSYDLKEIDDYRMTVIVANSPARFLELTYRDKEKQYLGVYYDSFEFSVATQYSIPAVHNRVQIISYDYNVNTGVGTCIFNYIVSSSPTGTMVVASATISASGSVTVSEIYRYETHKLVSGNSESFENIEIVGDNIVRLPGTRMSYLRSLYVSDASGPLYINWPVVEQSAPGPYLTVYSKLKPLFRAIAAAIRTKRGISTQIAAKDFYDQIGRIS